MKTIAQKAWRLLEAARNVAKAHDAKHGTWEVSSRMEDIDLHCDDSGAYADDSEGRDTVVASGDWNTIDKYDRATQTRVDVSDLRERLERAFSRLGIPCEWSDQCSTCGGCGKLIRTDADSCSWVPQYVISDGGIECAGCVDRASHLETLHGQLDDQVPSWIDPEKEGYTLRGEDMTRHEATLMFADLKNAGVWSCIVQSHGTYDHSVYILSDDVSR